MAMSRPQPVNVFLVATASAALHGGAAILVVPILSFMILSLSGPSAQMEGIVKTEDAMTLAVAAPLISAIFGFCAGALAGLFHNVFAHSQRRVTIAISEAPEVAAAASFSNVA